MVTTSWVTDGDCGCRDEPGGKYRRAGSLHYTPVANVTPPVSSAPVKERALFLFLPALGNRNGFLGGEGFALLTALKDAHVHWVIICC